MADPSIVVGPAATTSSGRRPPSRVFAATSERRSRPVQRYFDGAYFTINHARSKRGPSALARLFRREAVSIAEHCCQLLAPLAPTSVLDLGCGTGSLLSELRARGVSSASGVDISLRSLNVARQRLAHDPNVRFEHAPLEHCQALHASYDAVIALGLFDYSRLDGALIARLFACARQAVILTVPVTGMSLRRTARIAWLALHGIRLHTWNASSLAALAGAHACSWSIEVQRPSGQDNLWLVARRNAEGAVPR